MGVYFACFYIISTTWWVWFIYWMVSARRGKTVAWRESRRRQRPYLWMFLAACFLAFWPMFSIPVLGHFIIEPSITTSILGAAVCIAGAAHSIWARRTLAGNWSATVTLKEGHELVQRGPYRFSRHPIYTGMMLMFVGGAIHSPRVSYLLAVGLAFASFWIKTNQEEELMMKEFPEQYPVYRGRVKRIVPFLL